MAAKNSSHRRVTIKDVAKKAGVSIGTVSAVINNRPSVRSHTRNLVLDTMKHLNFRPRGQAQTLKRQYTEKCIGLIVRKIDHPFYSALATGVKHFANKNGYLVYIASSESQPESEQDIARSFVSKGVSGAIIAPALDGTVEIDHLFRLKMINFPFVMLEDIQGIQVNVVSINNSEAITEAVNYLIDCGHTNIIHFTGPDNDSHTFERINFFRQVFSETHLVLRRDAIVPCGGDFIDGYRSGIDYFHNIAKKKLPIAVICFNDMVAFGLISALKELKLRIPDQVAVIGIDDIDFARHWTPSLTTIGTSLLEMGEKAAEMLISIIESETTPPIKKIDLRAKLIIRETTCVLNRSTDKQSIQKSRQVV